MKRENSKEPQQILFLKFSQGWFWTFRDLWQRMQDNQSAFPSNNE